MDSPLRRLAEGPPGDPVETFPYQVGRFVLAFGSIEHSTYLCLDVLPAEPTPKFNRTLGLGQRIDLLIELLESPQVVGDEQAALVQVLKKVKTLAERRNLIAHNTVLFGVFEQAGKLSFNAEIVSGKDSKKRLTLAQTTDLADQVEALSSELWNAASPLLPRDYDDDLN